MISQLKILQRSDTKANKFDKEVWANELGPVLNLWKKLNQVRLDLLGGFLATSGQTLLGGSKRC